MYTLSIIFPDMEDFLMKNNHTILPQLQTRPEEITRQRTQLLPPYKVILFDDDYNEMNDVVRALLRSVNNLSRSAAEHIMLTAHLTGSAVVIVCPKEAAEYYQERLLSYGLMATIEPE
jgi:ATP-dependent Clp protease adaptor protein ClpS